MYKYLYKIRIWVGIFSKYILGIWGRKHRIFIMSTPWHGNLGDEAIVLAEYQLLREMFPDYSIIEYPSVIIERLMKYSIFSPTMQDEDILVLHGGGNLGSLYEYEEKIHRWAVEKYSEYRILFMPQSIFFEQDAKGKAELIKSKTIYEKAKNLTIMERDEISHEYGKKNFQYVNHLLLPDVVNALDCHEILVNDAQRKGVCLFLRSDKEKVLNNNIVERIKSFLIQKNIDFILTDTVIKSETRSLKKRTRAVFDKLYTARRSRLVITDRYHGTIFSVITHTPVIVFKSYDTKISAGIRWFNDLPWVHYAENMNIEEIENIIEKYCCSEEIKINKFSACPNIVRSEIAKWKKENCE